MYMYVCIYVRVYMYTHNTISPRTYQPQSWWRHDQSESRTCARSPAIPFPQKSLICPQKSPTSPPNISICPHKSRLCCLPELASLTCVQRSPTYPNEWPVLSTTSQECCVLQRAKAERSVSSFHELQDRVMSLSMPTVSHVYVYAYVCIYVYVYVYRNVLHTYVFVIMRLCVCLLFLSCKIVWCLSVCPPVSHIYVCPIALHGYVCVNMRVYVCLLFLRRKIV